MCGCACVSWKTERLKDLVSIRSCTALFAELLVKIHCSRKKHCRLNPSHYLSMNFTLLLEEDVRLRGQWENVPYHRDGRWTRWKPWGSSLLDELANQQESEEDDSHTAHTEQSLGAGHRHQRRRFNWNHLFPAWLPLLTSTSSQRDWSIYVSSCTFLTPASSRLRLASQLLVNFDLRLINNQDHFGDD